MSEVNLDELEDNKVQLLLKPYESDVEIAIVHYGQDWNIDDKRGLEYFTLNCNYDNVEDKIEIKVFNGFDEFIFNVCSLLRIGHITLDEDVSFDKMTFAPICERVKSIILSLEEFKMLDGFVGKFSICNPSFDFISLMISVKGIHESVCDGSETPEVNSELLLRGEKLFMWDW